MPEVGRIEALARRFRRGESGPGQTAADCLIRAGLAPARAIFTQLTPALARRQAGESARRFAQGRPLGLLDGIPVTWKDLFDVADTPTTCGSLVTDAAPALQDAACVARLHAAGAVSIGKTNLSEFAFSGLGMNPHFGTPVQRAPRTGARHLVGGSSSGAAAAMRLGIGCVALGTDTSGSIRVPAAYSGLVGFRPSTGRYPDAGVARLAPSLDTVGIIAATVADVVHVDAVLRGSTAAAPPPAPPRFVLVDNFCGDQVQPEVRQNCLRLLDKFSDAGLPCERQHVEIFDAVVHAFERHGTLVAAEAGYELACYTAPELLARIDPFVRRRLAAARAMPAHRLVALLQIRENLMRSLARQPANLVYVFPTTPTSAPALSRLRTLTQIGAANSAALRHTMPASFLDMPGITLPSGVDDAGLPTSVMLSSHRGSDEMLLSAARRLEAMHFFGP